MSERRGRIRRSSDVYFKYNIGLNVRYHPEVGGPDDGGNYFIVNRFPYKKSDSRGEHYVAAYELEQEDGNSILDGVFFEPGLSVGRTHR